MALHESSYEPKSRFAKWMDERLPIARLMHTQFVDFPTPRNLNYMWTFGGILTFFLMAQIVTGIVLAMHYQPSATEAFDSVEALRRDVNYGWLIRNLHAVGSSMFFLAAYLHIFRGLYYGSYKSPREVLWIIGVLIFVVMMATAFMGYSLPWGQMSFWAVTVITNLFSSLDSIVNGLGTTIVQWLWGGYAVTGVTLNRFYSLHYLLPFVIAGLVGLHLWALHLVGQNSPTGLDIKTPSDAVPMHPYATSKDAVGMFAFLMLFAWFVFFLPDYLGHADNYIPANPLVTPPHIVPEWYFLPYYAILRAIPSSCSASSRCSPRSACCCSCRGSTRAPCARPSTGRSTSGSSGCSYSPAWRSAIWAPSRRTAPTCSGRACSRSTILRISSSCCRSLAATRSRINCRAR